MVETALVTFIYPASVRFLTDLINSINQQIQKPSIMIIFNDGVENLKKLLIPLGVNYMVADVKGSPFEIRYYAVEYLRKLDVKNIVFQDSDDTLAQNRILVLSEKLETYELVTNDLSLMDMTGNVYQRNLWGNRLPNNFEFDYKFIGDKNIVGFGNTALRKSALDKSVIEYPDKTVLAADWYLFFQIIYTGKLKCLFTSKTTTLYRQHNENISAITVVATERKKRNKIVKRHHYKALENAGFDTDSLYRGSTVTGQSNKIRNSENLFWWE